MPSAEIILTGVSVGLAAFAGLSKALSNFQDKIHKRFEKLENSVDELEHRVIHKYVLKEDFLREIQGVNSKLDRILDLMMSR